MLLLNDKIVVDIKDYCFIQELKKFGPQPKTLLSVQTIVELLNQDINIVVPDKWSTEIYALVKTYNELAKKEKMKTADVAEKRLHDILVKDAKVMQESIPNPFKDDKPAAREYSPSMAPIMAQKLAAQGVSGKRYGLKMPTIKRVKAYELLVPPKNNIPPIEDTDFEGVQLDND